MRARGYAPATPCWSVLTTADPATAAAFYCGLFGWTTAPTETGDTAFLLNGLVVAGLTEAPGRPSAWLTYVSTEDIEATAASVIAAGGTILRPPAALGSLGQGALFADHEGAPFGAWQRGRFAGAQLHDEPGATCWSETVTWDVAATAAFYGRVFGWTEQVGTSDATHLYHEWLATNRVVGGISPMGEHYPPGTPQHWRTILLVDDCAGAIARTAGLGGRVLAGPVDAGIGSAAHILDPTGGAFLVIEMIPELRAML